MTDTLASLLALHSQLLEKLNEKLLVLTRREQDAQRALDECRLERVTIDRERDALRQAEKLYRDAFQSPESRYPAPVPPHPGADDLPPFEREAIPVTPPVDPSASKQRRARIGPQRYIMLDFIEMLAGLNEEQVIAFTRLPPKRVREQLGADLKEGILCLAGNAAAGTVKYELTPGGHDLLARFRRYKQAVGQALPTMEDSQAENDQDGARTESDRLEAMEVAEEDEPA